MHPRRSVPASVLLASVLAAALLTGSSATASTDDPPATGTPSARPVRVLVHGDSVSHGSAGDWTWRYRLWRHLRDSGTSVDLVGPRSDLWEGSRAYADADFDRDHAARWGMRRSAPDVPVRELVATHRPDVVVDGLGINDLRNASPAAVVRGAARAVSDARAVDPDVDVVLWRLPQTWRRGVVEHNRLLDAAVARLDTPRSRVVVADVAQGFDRRRDTYDSLHPSASGEVRIAAAVADALARIGVGSRFGRPLPAVDAGPVGRPTVQVSASVTGRATVRWTAPVGATSAEVDLRSDGTWRRVATVAAGRTATVRGLRAGRRYEVRVRAAKGSAVSPRPSASVAVSVPALSRVRVRPAAGRRTVLVRWSRATGAASYDVAWRRVGATRWTARRTSGRALRLAHLARGRTYEVRVRPMNDAGPGPMTTRRVRLR